MAKKNQEPAYAFIREVLPRDGSVLGTDARRRRAAEVAGGMPLEQLVVTHRSLASVSAEFAHLDTRPYRQGIESQLEAVADAEVAVLSPASRGKVRSVAATSTRRAAEMLEYVNFVPRDVARQYRREAAARLAA